MNQANKHICVIGGGSSGLTAIKQCVDQGFQVTCYEKTDNLGGLWRYRDDDLEGVASVAKTTIINTSKELSAFSDFPPPEEYPNYMEHRLMVTYFESYANHFDLISKIRFNHEILNVTFNDDYDETGKWKVRIFNKELNSTDEKVFDGVMLCTGHHVKPLVPKFPGQEVFKGEIHFLSTNNLTFANLKGKIMHSHSFKTWSGFEDKVAVVVGIGNSGGDVAVDLSKVCSKVYLATRSGSWVLNRVSLRGKPLDYLTNTRLLRFIQKLLPFHIVCSFFESFVNSYFDHELYGLKPKHRILSQHPTINDSLANCILSGRVAVRKNIQKFTENGVIFEGMNSETRCDIVVLATGYEIDFPYLDKSIIPVTNNRVDLYKNVFQPNLKYPQTLAVIGLVQPFGAIFPISEIQSRWFALLMAGKLKLPSKEQMLKTIKDDVQKIQSRYYNSSRHTIQVDFIDYMDNIASIIGAKPNLLKYAITDPWLYLKMILNPCTPYQYRLEGPNSWPGARQALMDLEKRIKAPLKVKEF